MLSLLAGAAAARTPQLSRVDKALSAVLAEVESFERRAVDYKKYFEEYNIMSLAESAAATPLTGCVAAVTYVGDGPVVDYTAGVGSCSQTDDLKEMYSKLMEGQNWLRDPDEIAKLSFSGFGSLHGDPLFFGDADKYFTMQLKYGEKCSVIGHSEWYVLVVSDLACTSHNNGMGQVRIGLERMLKDWGEDGY